MASEPDFRMKECIYDIRNPLFSDCVYTKIQTPFLEKRQTNVVDASRKKASRNLRTADPILLLSRSNTPAKVLKYPFSDLKVSRL